ncbi:hypothetical protein BD779DRAFT_1792120 [Infundibulicybe gibba]|nr:hypothetical protein BD779DRAFT_1792120 [Infundibulicybe gibba]
MTQEDSIEVCYISESEIGSIDSDCSDHVRNFWDNIMEGRISRIGGAPPPRQYPSATTSSIEALDGEKQVLEDAIELIRRRCAMEEAALQGALKDLRKHLQREERAIAQSITTIHRYRNPLIPVMRLPPEILSRIFVFHAQMGWGWLDAALTSTHVCKRWWEVGRVCPELWSYIKYEDCRSAAWMAQMIKRSGTVPLSLEFDDLPRINRRKMALIAKNMHRFESLELHVPEEAHGAFFKAFSQSPPLLQHLTLSNYEYSANAFPPKFLGGSVPSLRHLTLSTSSYVPWDSGLFANLTTLNVSGESEESADGNPPSLEMLLSALARMPDLETLVLSDCFYPPASSVTACPHVKLPNLGWLAVTAPLTFCTRFFRQISISARATIVLHPGCSNASKEDVREFFTVFPSHLCTASPLVSRALKFTWHASEFTIDAWTEQDMKPDVSQDASIKLIFNRDSDDSQSMSPLDLSWACFAGLTSPQLRSFRISNRHIVGWDVEVWRNFAYMAPGLRMLAPGRSVQCIELCKALSPPDGPNLVSADCCLPALSYLELEVPYNDLVPAPDGGESPLSVALAHSLAARASIGCSTPLLLLVSWEGSPEGWSKPFKEAVPGIIWLMSGFVCVAWVPLYRLQQQKRDGGPGI